MKINTTEKEQPTVMESNDKMENESVKLTEDEQQRIAKHQQKLNQATFELGNVEANLIDLKRKKDNISDKVDEINKQGEVVIEELVAKYGKGSLNLETMTFTKMPEAND